MKDAVKVIAEAGVNHNGCAALAQKLTKIAFRSGADFVKFQTFKADRLATKAAPLALYQGKPGQQNIGQLDMLKGLELSEIAFQDLKKLCQKLGIEFLSTGFDIASLKFLISLGMKLIKIPSGELTNTPLLRFVGSKALEVVLSTGMSTFMEIERAIEDIVSGGFNTTNLTLLHCTSAYPTPAAEVNLRAMVAMKEKFGLRVGFSDHTLDVKVGGLAVAAGATIIEKHFTLDRELVGPDHATSLVEDELSYYINCVREAEVFMGSGVKHPTISEQKNINMVRKSIVASTRIEVGDIFSDKNITTKRPLNGLCASEWDNVIGKQATESFAPDEPIKL